MARPITIEHHVEDIPPGSLVQRCTRCNKVIMDLGAGACWPAGPPPKGWPSGMLYFTGKNPTNIETTKPEDTVIINCIYLKEE